MGIDLPWSVDEDCAKKHQVMPASESLKFLGVAENLEELRRILKQTVHARSEIG
jgi:hypothetical protein